MSAHLQREIEQTQEARPLAVRLGGRPGADGAAGGSGPRRGPGPRGRAARPGHRPTRDRGGRGVHEDPGAPSAGGRRFAADHRHDEDQQRSGADRRHGGEHRPQGAGRWSANPRSKSPSTWGRCGRRRRPCSATASTPWSTWTCSRPPRSAAATTRWTDETSDPHRDRGAGSPGTRTASRAYLRLLAVSRNLERIADLATNIAEDVVYLVEGRIIRHAFKGG